MSCTTSCRSKHALQAVQEEVRLIKEERDKYRVALAKQRVAHTEDRVKIAELQTLLEEAQSELSDLRREKREREACMDLEPKKRASTVGSSRQSIVEESDTTKDENSDMTQSLLGDIFSAFGAARASTSTSPSPNPTKRASESESASSPPKAAKRPRPAEEDPQPSTSSTKAMPNTVTSTAGAKTQNGSLDKSPAKPKPRKPRTCITCRQTGCKGASNRRQCPKWTEPPSES